MKDEYSKFTERLDKLPGIEQYRQLFGSVFWLTPESTRDMRQLLLFEREDDLEIGLMRVIPSREYDKLWRVKPTVPLAFREAEDTFIPGVCVSTRVLKPHDIYQISKYLNPEWSQKTHPKIGNIRILEDVLWKKKLGFKTNELWWAYNFVIKTSKTYPEVGLSSDNEKELQSFLEMCKIKQNDWLTPKNYFSIVP